MEKLVCGECGGTNIETKAWIDPNDETILDSCGDGEIEDNWCRDCKEHVTFDILTDED